jgi:hypothetical protein
LLNPPRTKFLGMPLVQAAMTRNLVPDQWRNWEEWCLVSGRWRQLSNKPDREIKKKKHTMGWMRCAVVMHY